MMSSFEEALKSDPPFRLAFRTEGQMVNCYLAPMGSMEGAHLVSCMPLPVLQYERPIWDDWKALMNRALTVMCREALGVEPTHFTEETAPDHERAGNG